MSAYNKFLQSHLAAYKRTQLGVAADGLWRRNRKRYPHILPEEQADLNLLPTIRDACADLLATERIRRHSDFHHLTSSQAFALNVFFPFRMAAAEAGPALVAALDLRGAMEGVRFEVVLDAEEESNLDVVLELSGGRAIIEVKLTEPAFGAGRPDHARRVKWKDLYQPRLAGRVAPTALTEDVFFPHYQLLRNSSYADPRTQTTVILFMPRANGGLRSATEAFLSGFLTPPFREWVRIVFAEDLVGTLRHTVAGPPWLLSHLDDVTAKYLPPPPP